MNETCDHKPIIEYPTSWVYRVIGADSQRVADAVAEVVGEEPYVIEASHRSSSGKYHSFSVEMIVRDEEQRTTLFEALRGHPDVIMVL